MDKLLEKVISNQDYKLYSNKINKDIFSKNEIVNELKNSQEDNDRYIEFGLDVLNNINVVFDSSSYLLKKKLMSSMFDEKLEFDGKEYRTPKLKKGIEYIYKRINELEKEINNGKVQNEISSHLVPGVGLEPTRTLRSTGF